MTRPLVTCEAPGVEALLIFPDNETLSALAEEVTRRRGDHRDDQLESVASEENGNKNTRTMEL